MGKLSNVSNYLSTPPLLCKEATVKGVERITKVPDKRIWKVLHHYVGSALQNIDSSALTEIGIDETSRKRGHQYVTVAVDMEERKVFHVTQGKGKETCTSIANAISEQGGHPLQIQEVSMEMSPSFIQGSKESFPLTAITFDKFHIMKAINHALDEVRSSLSGRCRIKEPICKLFVKIYANESRQLLKKPMR